TGGDLSGQRHQAARHDRIVRPVRGAVAQSGESDGVQARDLDRGAQPQRQDWQWRVAHGRAGNRGFVEHRGHRCHLNAFFERNRKGERALLVTPYARGDGDGQRRAQEFTELAKSAGAQVLDRVSARVDAPNPRFYIGTGKADEVQEKVRTLRPTWCWSITRSRRCRNAIWKNISECVWSI